MKLHLKLSLILNLICMDTISRAQDQPPSSPCHVTSVTEYRDQNCRQSTNSLVTDEIARRTNLAIETEKCEFQSKFFLQGPKVKVKCLSGGTIEYLSYNEETCSVVSIQTKQISSNECVRLIWGNHMSSRSYNLMFTIEGTSDADGPSDKYSNSNSTVELTAEEVQDVYIGLWIIVGSIVFLCALIIFCCCRVCQNRQQSPQQTVIVKNTQQQAQPPNPQVNQQNNIQMVAQQQQMMGQPHIQMQMQPQMQQMQMQNYGNPQQQQQPYMALQQNYPMGVGPQGVPAPMVQQQQDPMVYYGQPVVSEAPQGQPVMMGMGQPIGGQLAYGPQDQQPVNQADINLQLQGYPQGKQM